MECYICKKEISKEEINEAKIESLRVSKDQTIYAHKNHTGVETEYDEQLKKM